MYMARPNAISENLRYNKTTKTHILLYYMYVIRTSYSRYLCECLEITNTATYFTCLFYRHLLSKCYALYSVTEEM